MIGGDAVRAQEHEIFKLAVGKLDAADDSVVEGGNAALRHAEADGCGLSCGATLGSIRGRDDAAAAIVHGRLAGLGRDLAAVLQVILRAEAGIRMAGIEQLLRGGLVEIEPLRLIERALVPVEAEPAHAFEDALDHGFGRALEIGVFDAQDESAAGVAGEEPVEERGAGAANVQVASGRGSEADAGTFRD